MEQEKETYNESFRKEFGTLTKKQANSTWVCDVLTGLVSKVKFKRESILSKKGVLVRNYWTFAKKSYFYTTAVDKTEAIEKFNASFANWNPEQGIESITKKQNYV